MGLDREERRYEEIGQDVSKVVAVLEEYLDEYNLSNTNALNLGAWRLRGPGCWGGAGRGRAGWGGAGRGGAGRGGVEWSGVCVWVGGVGGG